MSSLASNIPNGYYIDMTPSLKQAFQAFVQWTGSLNRDEALAILEASERPDDEENAAISIQTMTAVYGCGLPEDDERLLHRLIKRYILDIANIGTS